MGVGVRAGAAETPCVLGAKGVQPFVYERQKVEREIQLRLIKLIHISTLATWRSFVSHSHRICQSNARASRTHKHTYEDPGPVAHHTQHQALRHTRHRGGTRMGTRIFTQHTAQCPSKFIAFRIRPQPVDQVHPSKNPIHKV